MQLSVAEQAALDAAGRRDAGLSTQTERRKRDGVVHTPPELARFVARSVDELLHDDLAIERGLADRRVQIIDPACGPGAFLAASLQVASEHGAVEATLSGIDRDREAVEAAREALRSTRHEGLSLVCTDTLRDDTLFEQLVERAQGDHTVVVIGNPPWTVSAADATPQMQHLLEDFRCDAEGRRLAEKKLGVLSDTYVRFFRWSIELARKAPGGAIVALVTNSSFLDGPVQRGMRAAMLRWFDALYVVDCGGNAMLARARGEKARDENVFGVRPGVVVTFLVRRAAARNAATEMISYARMHGTLTQKLDSLATSTLRDLSPSPHTATLPHARFVPGGERSTRYASYVSLEECMPFHREGVQSNRDSIVVARDRASLISRLRRFVAGDSDSDLELANAPLAHYDPQAARRAVARALELDADGTRNVSARTLSYRPFDTRWFCPVTPLCHRPRPDLLSALDHGGSALVAVRKDRSSVPYAHFGATVTAIDNCFLSARSSCRTRAFPVRTPSGEQNLRAEIRDMFEAHLGLAVDAQAFVHYALAVLASPTYRREHHDELCLDYPRVPIPNSRACFDACVDAGRRLAETFVVPLDGSLTAVDVDLTEARFSDLKMDAANGGLWLRGRVLIEADPVSLSQRVGHHEVMRAFIASRKPRLLDSRALGELRALAQRLARLHTDVLRCEQAVQPLLQPAG